MHFAIKINGYVYKVDEDENYLEFDDNEFWDKFIRFIESNDMFFGGVLTKVDLSKEDE